MTIERKVGMGIAGQPSGGATDVAEVFSTQLYTGTGGGSYKRIVNGIDLSAESGLVWSRKRGGGNHVLVDTVRGITKSIFSNLTNGNATQASNQDITSFNADGYWLGALGNGLNSADPWVSWTFREKEKFFDIVTWTGNGADGRQIAHSLNSAPAMMLVKRTDSPENWAVYHKNVNGGDAYLKLDTTAALDNRGELLWGNGTNFIAPTSTVFTIGSFGGLANANGGTYIAYLFADNSSEDADDQMIKCGGYTGTNTNNGPVVNLGWEPQFVMIKSSNGSGNWIMFDTMRGMTVDGTDSFLMANANNAESGFSFINVTPTGFKLITNEGQVNGNETYIYMAIRAPMMKKPEAATDVFHVEVANNNSAPDITTGFPIDMGIYAQRSKAANDDTTVVDRIRGGFKRLVTNKSDAEATGSSGQEFEFDHSNKVVNNHLTVNSSSVHWLWKRAKGYMDCVAYSGNATAGRTVAHSLGVVPEMIWVRTRSSAELFAVYHTSEGATKYALFNTTAFDSFAGAWNNTAPTTTEFSVGNWGKVNANNVTYIAYLFATLAGISKVGSYTGNGSYQTINCGFSAGSRFILIKRTDSSADWYIWDTTRGIIAGNDPHLSLNSTAAEVTSNDSIDPANSGFIVNQVSATNINVSSGTYIFYAIA